jgi:hypothetical protein
MPGHLLSDESRFYSYARQRCRRRNDANCSAFQLRGRAAGAAHVRMPPLPRAAREPCGYSEPVTPAISCHVAGRGGNHLLRANASRCGANGNAKGAPFRRRIGGALVGTRIGSSLSGAFACPPDASPRSIRVFKFLQSSDSDSRSSGGPTAQQQGPDQFQGPALRGAAGFLPGSLLSPGRD